MNNNKNATNKSCLTLFFSLHILILITLFVCDKNSICLNIFRSLVILQCKKTRNFHANLAMFMLRRQSVTDALLLLPLVEHTEKKFPHNVVVNLIIISFLRNHLYVMSPHRVERLRKNNRAREKESFEFLVNRSLSRDYEWARDEILFLIIVIIIFESIKFYKSLIDKLMLVKSYEGVGKCGFHFLNLI